MELIEVWLKWEDRVGWIPTFVTVITLHGVLYFFLSKTRITGLHSGNSIFLIKSELKIWKHCRMQQKLHHFHQAVGQDIFFLDCNLLLSLMQTYCKRYACLLKTDLVPVLIITQTKVEWTWVFKFHSSWFSFVNQDMSVLEICWDRRAHTVMVLKKKWKSEMREMLTLTLI